jgi:hypothetical protein
MPISRDDPPITGNSVTVKPVSDSLSVSSRVDLFHTKLSS